jgi:acetoin utilization deacetylase AcuC-like enzyme
MKTVYSPDQLLHDVRVEVTSGAAREPYETPARALAVQDAIISSGLGEIIQPREHTLEPLQAVHSKTYIEFLQAAWALWVEECGPDLDAIPYCFPQRGLHQVEPRNIEGKLGYYSFDLSSAIGSGTWAGVRAAVNCALTAADLVMAGEPAAFALCRPPGHHAGRDLMGGYCYINNAAVAAQSFRDQGYRRVAVLDVDYHHGNGTQDIFYSRSDVLFVSIHADPEDEYPHFSGYAAETGDGRGVGFNINYPSHLGTTDWTVYSDLLARALKNIETFAADALVVSLGLDTFNGDPISQFQLLTDDFIQMGRMIGGAKLPTVFVLEGGYAMDDLGANTVNVLRGFEAG